MESGSEINLRKVLRTYLTDNEKVVRKKLKKKPGADQMKATHQLRVATKRIRSVMRLIEFLNPDDFRAKKEIQELRMLFRFAGIQRELQVDRKVLTMYEEKHLTIYKHLGELMEEERKYSDYLFKQAKKDFKLKSLHRPIEKAQKLLKQVPNKAVLEGARSLINIRLKSIQQVMPEDYDRILIHKARILLKEAMYLMELLRQAGDKASFSKKLIANAKAASEVAGEWHDTESLEQWLRIQMRPDGPIQINDAKYQLLTQEVKDNARSLALEFRKALSKVVEVEIKGENLVGNSGEE